MSAPHKAPHPAPQNPSSDELKTKLWAPKPESSPNGGDQGKSEQPDILRYQREVVTWDLTKEKLGLAIEESCYGLQNQEESIWVWVLLWGSLYPEDIKEELSTVEFSSFPAADLQPRLLFPFSWRGLQNVRKKWILSQHYRVKESHRTCDSLKKKKITNLLMEEIILDCPNPKSERP